MDSKPHPSRNLSNQSEAVIHFLKVLDIDMISLVLDDNRTYQDFKKHVFIQKLAAALDQFVQSGDTYLNHYNGFCNSELCNYRCKGYSFVGNNSGNYFNLIFSVEDGVVNDIYECTEFKCLDENVKTNERIEIDKFKMPF
jgi:hypothetical protein